MDPFTQRMLERARARREKADLPPESMDLGIKRIPLQDTNYTSPQKLKVTTEVEVTLKGNYKVENIKDVNISPTKVSLHSPENKENETNDKGDCADDDSAGSAVLREDAKLRLKRLGTLYSGTDCTISSPVHRTEETFSAESEEAPKAQKSTTRLARLAALANTINEWEDDLSHPAINEPKGLTVAKTEYKPKHLKKAEAKETLIKKAEYFETNKSQEIEMPKPKLISVSKSSEASDVGVSRNNEGTKNCIWDKAILEALEAQGFTRTVSNARLVYHFSKRSSQDGNNTSGKSATKSFGIKNDIKEIVDTNDKSPVKTNSASNDTKMFRSPVMGISNFHSPNSKLNSSPEKQVTNWKKGLSPQKHDQPKMGLRSVAESASGNSPRRGSVLQKAAVFESGSPERKLIKDPAEMSVSERLALFERNKGEALIPKAAFSMAVPAKILNKKQEENVYSRKLSPERKSISTQWTRLGNFGVVEKLVDESQKASPIKNNLPANKVLANKQLFESGALRSQDNSILRTVHSERQKEMEMLLNRWNKNKEIGSETNSSKENSTNKDAPVNTYPEVHSASGMTPIPPPLPQLPELPTVHSVHLKPSAFKGNELSSKTEQNSVVSENASQSISAVRKHLSNPKEQYPVLGEVKRFNIGDPKPGRLYPCLSDIETCTETESEVPDEDSASSESNDSCSNIGDTSFGREILHAAGINKSPQQSEDSESEPSTSESAVLKEMDEVLDCNSNSDSESEGPTPPKRTKAQIQSPQKTPTSSPKKYRSPVKHHSPTTSSSQSFKYSRGQLQAADEENCPLPTHVVDGDQQMPLMHTVSFYRRQQNMALKSTPVRQIVRSPKPVLNVTYDPDESIVFPPDDRNTVRNKVSALLDEVTKQQNVISQASQALNLCCATVEFSGSSEQVEGERLLLLATHRRQAALHEIQRLEIEGTLRPGGSSGPNEQGALIVTDIVLPIKKEYIHIMSEDDTCHHFVCLLRSQEQVLGTPVLAATPAALKSENGLRWAGPLRLSNLYTDFKATLEVYSMQTRKEILPHNVKYHIGGCSSGKKESSKLRLTPKKHLKQDSRLIMPTVQSPAGPSAVRTPSFQLAGYVVFSLKEVNRTHFTLNKVAHKSPLEGNVQVRLCSELSLDVTERGFLTMFEDVSGFGAWHRRWCLLKGSTLAYWKYPDDERKKDPIGWIDLKSCSTQTVGLVSRDICARPNTFLLETIRPPRADDVDSLILIRSKNCTTIRHLLSADTKEDRLIWCSQLNKTLSMIRTWDNRRS